MLHFVYNIITFSCFHSVLTLFSTNYCSFMRDRCGPATPFFGRSELTLTVRCAGPWNACIVYVAVNELAIRSDNTAKRNVNDTETETSGKIPVVVTSRSAVPCRPRHSNRDRTAMCVQWPSRQSRVEATPASCDLVCSTRDWSARNPLPSRGPIFEKSHDKLTKNLRKSLTYEKVRMSMWFSKKSYRNLTKT